MRGNMSGLFYLDVYGQYKESSNYSTQMIKKRPEMAHLKNIKIMPLALQRSEVTKLKQMVGCTYYQPINVLRLQITMPREV